MCSELCSGFISFFSWGKEKDIDFSMEVHLLGEKFHIKTNEQTKNHSAKQRQLKSKQTNEKQRKRNSIPYLGCCICPCANTGGKDCGQKAACPNNLVFTKSKIQSKTLANAAKSLSSSRAVCIQVQQKNLFIFLCCPIFNHQLNGSCCLLYFSLPSSHSGVKWEKQIWLPYNPISDHCLSKLSRLLEFMPSV